MTPIPPEWAPHERTLMGWPCRLDLWEDRLEEAKEEYAGVANAIAAFEPVLMVCRPGDGDEARAALAGGVEVWEAPIDDSWLRDNGPIFTGPDDAVCFGFNAWGGKFPPWDDDATLAPRLCDRLGKAWTRSDMVLEGGSIAIDADGSLITTEQCLLHPNRNPTMSRADIERELVARLGVTRVVWLGDGLVEDRDTDGHVDLICVPTPSNGVLLQTVAEDNPNFEAMEDNRRRLEDAGIEIMPFDVLAYDDDVVVSYLNAYVCNGAVIVPQAGQPDLDEHALEIYRLAFPDHEPVGVPGRTIAFGGGGPHCITQQVPLPG
ncbi:MAG TPA: agmatine deiminase family protein [Capillimicrobium sp.]